MSDLKAGKYKPVYLLHGEEPYYVDLVSDYIEKNVLSDGEKGFNQTVLYGRDTDVQTILNAAKRYPMMSDYQVVIVKEAQELKWGKEGVGDPFAGYVENPLRSTILVICFKYARFDKRKKLYKAFEKSGVVLESAPIYESKLPAWIEEAVAAKGYRVHARAAAMIAGYLGNDLSKIANELEKLMLNIPKGQEISPDDVQNNIGISKEYNVFELQAAIAKRDIFKANQVIDYFAANPKSNPAVLVLGNLNTYFGKVLKYHYVADRSPQGLARELGVNPYFVKDYEMAGRNYPVGKIFNVISYLRDYDLKTKGVDSTGNTTQGELMKELVFKIIH
nr:DNA polymerase III subunit delta [Hufsiella ginkgonis]